MNSAPMNHAPFLSYRLVAALAASRLILTLAPQIMIGEAFSVVTMRAMDTVPSPPHSGYSTRATQRLRRPSVAASASLRDLLDVSNDDGLTNKKHYADKGTGSEADKQLTPRVSPENARSAAAPGPGAPRDFKNLVNYSRSKFAETKFRARNVYGTGYESDEVDSRGLHADRLQTFSFSSNRRQSGSEGGSPEEKEEEDGYLLPVENEYSDEEGGVEDSSAESAPDYSKVDNFMANDPLNNNMVGINYSKRASFPSRSKEIISDEDDQLGLHKDRLSTFSFSNAKEGPSIIVKKLQELSSPEKEEGDDKVITDNLSGDTTDAGRDNSSLGVDDFHDNVNIDRTIRSGGARTTSPLLSNAGPDPSDPGNGKDTNAEGQANHADRFSTFSLSDVNKQPTTLEDRASPIRSSVSTGSNGGGSLPPREKSNHDSRLGTFSFGGQPRAGPAPLPPLDAVDVPPSRITAATGGSDYSGNSGSTYLPNTARDASRRVADHDDRLGTYSLPQSSTGSSLSSIASGVSVKSRNDRIEEMKTRHDPRRLHPDGMNTPRLNSKGDVMSLGSGGKPTIFQRIEEQASREGPVEVEDGREEDGREEADDADEKVSKESAEKAQ